MVTGHLSEGSFVRNAAVQIPKFLEFWHWLQQNLYTTNTQQTVLSCSPRFEMERHSKTKYTPISDCNKSYGWLTSWQLPVVLDCIWAEFPDSQSVTHDEMKPGNPQQNVALLSPDRPPMHHHFQLLWYGLADLSKSTPFSIYKLCNKTQLKEQNHSLFREELPQHKRTYILYCYYSGSVADFYHETPCICMILAVGWLIVSQRRSV